MEMSCSDRDSYFLQDLYVLRRPFSLVLRDCKHAVKVKGILLSKRQYFWNIYFNEAVDKGQLARDDDCTKFMQKILPCAVSF
jgi:hypothetical protein